MHKVILFFWRLPYLDNYFQRKNRTNLRNTDLKVSIRVMVRVNNMVFPPYTVQCMTHRLQLLFMHGPSSNKWSLFLSTTFWPAKMVVGLSDCSRCGCPVCECVIYWFFLRDTVESILKAVNVSDLCIYAGHFLPEEGFAIYVLYTHLAVKSNIWNAREAIISEICSGQLIDLD